MAYVGEYRDRLRDGHGSYVFPIGSFRYEGDWKRGKMDGRGVFFLPDGGSYEGEFQNGEIDGIGLRRWPDGSTYNGHFRRGERHGEGVFIASSGDVYEGHWRNNQRHGLGELRAVNGDVYRGDFYHHRPHGNGRIRFATDASTYDGDWVDGKICGRGLLRDAHGRQLYDGEWLNGQRCGHGVGLISDSTTTSSVVFDGVWVDDKPIAPTTKLAFKTVVRQSADESMPTNGKEPMEMDYQDIPGVIMLDKKTGSLRLPLLAGVSLHAPSHENSPSIVRGESGRLLRLRIFEGPIPAAVLSVPERSDPSEAITPPSQWQFISASPPSDGGRGLAPSGASVPLGEGGSEVPTPEEERISEVIVQNGAGISIFEDVALSTTTLAGTYHLMCDGVDSGDDVIPTFVTVQIVE